MCMYSLLQSSRYSVRYREMVEAGATVFADADEEFASIAAVKKRLEEWKSRWGGDPGNGQEEGHLQKHKGRHGRAVT